MEPIYYHGVTGGMHPKTPESEKLKESLRVLKSILKYQAIYSRRIMKEKGIIIPDYKESYNFDNGEDYISICTDSCSQKSCYNGYVRGEVAIEFKPSIKTCVFRLEPYEHLEGEAQIRAIITANHFNRIVIGFFDEIVVRRALREIGRITDIPVMTLDEAEAIHSRERRQSLD